MYQINIALIFVIIASFASCKVIDSKFKPDDHCNGLDCPKYTVVDKNEDFEMRKYPSYKWAAARETDLVYSAASKKNFMKLLRYIQGDNTEKQKIEMTVPVLNSLIVSQGSFWEADFTMHFFVPYKYQANPPKPMNDTDQVFIMETPEATVYVRSYGGLSNDQKIQENVAALAIALQKRGLRFDAKHYYTAGYDSRSSVLNQHNEVLFIAQN